MLMQKQYDEAGKVTHVRIKHTGVDAEQNFSHRLVEQALADGWMTIESGHLHVKTDGDPLRYALNAYPGYYCVSTGQRIPVSEVAWGRFRSTGNSDLSRREALAWLAANGKAADDYRVTHAYECVLDEAQHEKFHAVLAPTGDKVAVYTQEA